MEKAVMNKAAIDTIILTAMLLVPLSPLSFGQTLFNGDFEADMAKFLIPVGWTPYGCAKFEAGSDGDWIAQVADVNSQQCAGLYQMANVLPGRRYRLSVRGRSGHSELYSDVGLCPSRSADPGETVWSTGYNQGAWTTQTVEATAVSPHMTVILRARNTNPQWKRYEWVAWDDVSLEITGIVPTQTPGPVPTEPIMPMANDVFGQLANLWSLTEPKEGVRTYLAGTHNPDIHSNIDYNFFEGEINDGGETWKVLKTFTGPGALCRFWMTNYAKGGLIRIYVDGLRVVDCSIEEFFCGCGNFPWPLANQNSGAWASSVPIPFVQSARVQVRNAVSDRFYWQITHQRFPSTEGVRSFTNPMNPTDTAHLKTIRHQWGVATLNPKPELPETQENAGTINAGPGSSVTLFSVSGAGMIDSIQINVPSENQSVLQGLRIEATWDDAATPQVDAPYGLFFGVAYGRKITRALMIGMTPGDGGYCYFPMPFRTGARIVLRNTTATPIMNVPYRVRWVPRTPDRIGPLRFHTIATHQNPAGYQQLFVPFEIEGSGHFVGTSNGMARIDGTEWGFLEGDEYIWVDGETEPSTAGTGTEDYFSCGWYFMAGPITLAGYGAPEVNRNPYRISAYRMHIPDWVPFDSSFRFGIEVGDNVGASTVGNYSMLGYFYLATGDSPVSEASSLMVK